MADRRMLWKSISQSKKVNSLSFEAAFLWTWCVPWFDRDGLLDGDPDFIKWNVVPRRKEFTMINIPTFCSEIVKSGLWAELKLPTGGSVFRENSFKEHQSLRYDKEIKSKFEGIELLRQTNDSHGTDQGPSHDEPMLYKGSGVEVEGKVVKGKEGEYEGKPNSSLELHPEFKEKEKPKEPFHPNCSDEQRQKIQTLTLQLHSKWPLVHKFVNQFILTAHPESIILALTRVKENQKVSDKWKYAEKIISVESGNLREKDFNKFKPDFSGLLSNIKKVTETIKD